MPGRSAAAHYSQFSEEERLHVLTGSRQAIGSLRYAADARTPAANAALRASGSEKPNVREQPVFTEHNPFTRIPSYFHVYG